MTKKSASLGGVDFEFVPNVAGESNGLNDAGIETYKSNPFASLGRECGQNSNDARTRRPVIVNFDVIEEPISSVPGAAKLKAAVEACLKTAILRKDEKATDFFSHARKVLGASSIKIMRVADLNTTGLTGPCEPGTPFHALLKSAGESNKGENTTSGGSFGIGKNAAFAASELRTVFYSTLYRLPNADTSYFLAQGKAKLMSHDDEGGNAKLATGYWGHAETFTPVSEQHLAPPWMRRNEIGTSVFALGFHHSANWQFKIAYSLLVNFFAAIQRGDMQFNVNSGRIAINANSIDALFNDKRVYAAAEEDNRSEDFEFARHLFKCLTSPDAIEKTVSVRGLGEISIRVLIGEELPKRVGIIRNGMMITDSLKHFGERFDRFPLYKDFVSLVEPLESEGSALIKKLESPRHDELSAGFIPDPNKAAAASVAMKALAKRIRETIKSETKIQHDAEVPIDEMSEFFADRSPSTLPPDPTGEKNPEKFRYELKTSKKVIRGVPPGSGAVGGGSAPDGKPNSTTGGTGVGGASDEGAGTGGSASSTPARLRNVRSTLPPDRRLEKRQIYFTPLTDGQATISVQASGLNEAERLAIVKADKGEVKNGKLHLALTAQTRTSVCVEFSESYDGPIEVSALIQEPSQ